MNKPKKYLNVLAEPESYQAGYRDGIKAFVKELKEIFPFNLCECLHYKEDHDEENEGYQGTGKYKPLSVRFMLEEARADQFRKDTKEIFDKVDTMCIKYLVNTETVDINALNNFIEEYQELKKKYGVD
jgi:hypothetical protein